MKTKNIKRYETWEIPVINPNGNILFANGVPSVIRKGKVFFCLYSGRENKYQNLLWKPGHNAMAWESVHPFSFPENSSYSLYPTKLKLNQLLQLCTARTAWSDSDQAVRTVHSCNSWWLALLWSDSVIKLVSVLFGKCTTLVVTKCWPMVIRQPCGDQWKAENLGAFWRWPITRCLIKSDIS